VSTYPLRSRLLDGASLLVVLALGWLVLQGAAAHAGRQRIDARTCLPTPSAAPGPAPEFPASQRPGGEPSVSR
jgi:hypothetical protein